MLSALMIAWIEPGQPIGVFPSLADCFEKQVETETLLREVFPKLWVQCKVIPGGGALLTSPIPKPKPEQ